MPSSIGFFFPFFQHVPYITLTHVSVPNGLPCGSRVIHLHHGACNAMQAESLSKHICTSAAAAAGVAIIEYAYLTREKQRLVRRAQVCHERVGFYMYR